MAKSIEWRPGPTVCRCCLTEGCYKDVSTEYFWMGKREVYAEMLLEAFSVTIEYSQSGGPNSNSRLICEPCISRLRDANDFRKQVLECEKTFMRHLVPGPSRGGGDFVELDVDDPVDNMKLEGIKLETRINYDDFDDLDFNDDDDDDDLDDEPLTKLASKLPKKESVDVTDLLDNKKAAVKRKCTTKVTAAPPNKAKKKVRKDPATEAASKPEKKKKEFDPLVEARQNAKVVLRYSTAYPFRIPANEMVCVYCCEPHEDPQKYRDHMKRDHDTFNVDTAFAHTVSTSEYIKVDCTDLRCRLCCEQYDTINSVAKHLHLEHDKKINLTAEVGLQIFKLGQERWVCAVCSLKFPSLRALSRHNSCHYHKYTCETCGKSYISKENLNKHILFSHSEEKICVKCRKSFPNSEARRLHILATKRCWPFACNLCGERFVSRKLKIVHKSEVHSVGLAKKSHKCPECQQSFEEWRQYRSHFIISHTDSNYVCPFCGIKFDTRGALESHRVIHTKEKIFHCTVCTKSFLRKKNLAQHMWIHSEHKRFQCIPCNKQFNQRVSWKTHMRSYHPELVDF